MKNIIYSLDDLKKYGLKLTDPGDIFFTKLTENRKDQAIIIDTGRFLTIIAKNGEKIIYDTTKISNFTQEILHELAEHGTSPEKIDEIVDRFNGRDTLGLVIDENGNPWSPSEYHDIIDDPKKREEFNKAHTQNKTPRRNIEAMDR